MKRAKRLLAKLLIISMVMNLLSMSSFAVPQGYEGLEPICMQTEHVHGDKCFEQKLICGQAVASGSNAEDVASDSNSDVLASDSNAAHEHGESCYTKKVVCELPEHVHMEECFEMKKSDMLTLPAGGEIPEGYDVAYNYVDENGQFTVTVYATEDALPVGAELIAEIIEEDSAAYAKAEEALAEMPAEEGSDEELLELMEVELSDDELEEFGIEEDIEEAEKGFVALDIRFELDGEEIEPSESVYVCINALGLIPEDADPNSVAIQHHVEDDEVELVADSSEDTGIVEVSENEEEAALDVATVFAVDSFSTFTITWNTTEAGVVKATVYYLDAEGNEIELNGNTTGVLELPQGKAYYTDAIHHSVNHEGYVYMRSYVRINGREIPVVRMGVTKTGRFAYMSRRGETEYTYVERNDLGSHFEVFMEFCKLNNFSGDGYIENPIHEDIKLTLYDYGSYISYGDDKALQFGYCDREAEAIDGFPQNAKGKPDTKGELSILLDQAAINAAKLVCGVPVLEKTLNADGFPQIRSGYRQGGKSLGYLFPSSMDKDGKPVPALNTGKAINPLDDYKNMRTNAEIYYAYSDKAPNANDYHTHFSYNTNYESMRFDLEGDGGLFTVDEDGYYVYDSGEMSAYYNQDKGRFELSNMLIGPTHDPEISTIETSGDCGKNFVPFDRIPFEKLANGEYQDRIRSYQFGTEKKVYATPYIESEDYVFNEETDGWIKQEVINMFFGMVMEIDFYVPKDGKINGRDMVFEFCGDDDVWVYLDDVRVLDIGGCHGKIEGSINFATGEVIDPNHARTYSKNNRSLQETFAEAGISTEDGFEENGRFSDYTKHTLKFFYLERGGNISYCRLRFNMPTLPEKSLTVTKELEIENENETTDMVKNALTYEFRVLQADEDGNATDKLLVEEGETFTILKDGKPIGKGKVGKDGYFGLRAGEAAQFDDMLKRAEKAGYTNLEDAAYIVEERLPKNVNGIYNDVKYDVFGIENNIKKEDGTTVGFTTYQTGDLDADEAQIVTYRNQVNTEALRHLRITKVDAGKEGPTRQDTYQIKLLVCSDGENPDQFEPISIGTEYIVKTPGSTGDGTKKVVSKAGIIELKANETAELRVLPGTQYKVREEVNSNYNYYDTYTLYDSEHPNGLDLGQMESDEYYACGTFEPELEDGENPDETVKITNNYYLRIFKVVVNYLDKDTGETLAESYIDSRVEEFSPYDVTDKDQIEIEGYDYNSTVGDPLKSDSIDADKVINVYYTKIPEYDLIVNYYDKATGEKLATSYEELDLRRDTPYDVNDKDDEVVFAGYKYDSTTGDALSGTMTSDKVINVYYIKKLKLDVTVNYYDKATNEKLAASYEVLELEEGTAYDVSDKDNEVVIDGYTYDSTTGDALSGIMDTDKVINVYFTKNPEPTTEAPTTEAPTTEAPTTEWEDDDDEPETTHTTAAPTATPETTVPETTAPETSVPETTPESTVVYRGVEIPEEILEEIREEYGDYTLDELWEMGVLGAYFEKIPMGLLPATGDFSWFWTIMTALFGVSLAVVTVLDRKRGQNK